QELEDEIRSLRRLTGMAEAVRNSRLDKKWDKLRDVLENPEMFDTAGGRRKLVIFTEHKDTLTYLADRIGNSLLGRPQAVVVIHGGLGREERRKAQARFLNEADALVLLATDAAGEGVNLQRAHLMVNYDLPWNPNRIEQRFGRIHRYGQKEVCHLWNLVAYQTREGAVYQRLFEKLEEEREALQGKVFDVLGRLFTEVALRDLMLEAIRYNTTDEARAKMREKVDSAWKPGMLEEIVEERALDSVVLNTARLRQLKEDMARAEARKLVPHFVEEFFVAGFQHLGGNLVKREPGRYELRQVPADLRNRDRIIGRREPVTRTYERVCFDRAHRSLEGKPDARLITPGHPLLDSLIDVLMERHRDVLRRGSVLIDDSAEDRGARVLFSIESDVTDGRTTAEGNRRVISRRGEYVEDGGAALAGAAPYLDYRPPTDAESERAKELAAAGWLTAEIEAMAMEQGIINVVSAHVDQVRKDRQEIVDKTMAAVKARLTSEIQYWDHRAEELREQELAGRKPKLNSANARRRCEELEERLERRLKELAAERDVAARPPVVHGGALVLPAWMVAPDSDERTAMEAETRETKRIELLAMQHVVAMETAAGRKPKDVSAQNVGYDIESTDETGTLRMIEVKGRKAGAETVAVSKNEALVCLNKRGDYYLAIVWVDGAQVVDYWTGPDPMRGSWSFAMTSMNLDVAKLRAGAAV
ncbi:MAG TPA: helicase-related protein, partial [Tepidiformaceae bacterium]|nr:helicase-related protein [Tepidiformaceae bacterium]